MAKLPVFFFNQDISYELKNKTLVRSWIADAILAEGYGLEELNFIFCSDTYLLGLNQQFLNHDTYTDVITFDNSEELKSIVGDIFISIDRIRENARENKVSARHELCRVMIHGTLHLLGYKDKRKADKLRMTEKEDHYLSQL
ncbi:MAG: rRNA maturation RNase YbeY [Bacteroidota bacterium]